MCDRIGLTIPLSLTSQAIVLLIGSIVARPLPKAFPVAGGTSFCGRNSVEYITAPPLLTASGPRTAPFGQPLVRTFTKNVPGACRICVTKSDVTGNVPVSVLLLNEAVGVNATTAGPADLVISAPVIDEPRFATVMFTMMFCRAESKVTVAFPNPDVEQGGDSCDPVSTAPSVCAKRFPVASTATAKLRMMARRVISPPACGGDTSA